MNIYIYSSDPVISDILRSMIRETMIRFRCNSKVYTYNSLAAVNGKVADLAREMDILVLDLDSSSELLKTLEVFRTTNTNAGIIFISESYQKLNTYSFLRPSGYLLKPLDKNVFLHSFGRMVLEQKNMTRYFPVRINHTLVKIPYSDIDYFESNQRNVLLHLNYRNTIHTFMAKLDEIEEKLMNANFIRCHQSYLVNMDHVKMLDKFNRQLIFFSGNSVEISKRMLGKTVDAFQLDP